MSWEDKIIRCFGSEDCLFAVTQPDCIKAAELLLELVTDGNVAWSDLEKKTRDKLNEKLKARSISQEKIASHIEEQLKKMEPLYKPWLKPEN